MFDKLFEQIKATELANKILETYKRVDTDKKIILGNGVEASPVATLADEYGGRAQIIVDDNCYMLHLIQDDRTYKYTAWIFPEAHEVLKDLPDLRRVQTTAKVVRVESRTNEFSTKGKVTKTFKIIATPSVMKKFENFLGFLHFNTGHSGLFAMSFDGDGDDILRCEPAPEKHVKPGKKDVRDVAGGSVEIANEDGYQTLSVKDKSDSYGSPDKEEEN